MFNISEELKKLGDEVIAEYKEFKPIADSNCRIAYLYCDKEKTSNGKKVYADTTKVNDKVKPLAQYDFVITFYKPTCAMLDAEKMKILMRHELKHIGVKDGKFKILPHDVEDFSDILEEHGMNWII